MKYLKLFNESLDVATKYLFNEDKVIELIELCFIELGDEVTYPRNSFIRQNGLFQIDYDFTHNNGDVLLRISICKNPIKNSSEELMKMFIDFTIDEILESIEKMISYLDAYDFEYFAYGHSVETGDDIEYDESIFKNITELPYSYLNQLEIDIKIN